MAPAVAVGKANTKTNQKPQQHNDTKLNLDLPAWGSPRDRLARRGQCIPPGALLTGGLGEAKI